MCCTMAFERFFACCRAAGCTDFAGQNEGFSFIFGCDAQACFADFLGKSFFGGIGTTRQLSRVFLMPFALTTG